MRCFAEVINQFIWVLTPLAPSSCFVLTDFNQASTFDMIYIINSFHIAKMVLLTIVAPSNPHTVYFDHDIANPNYIRLLSASMYNSWYNFEDNGTTSVRQAQAENSNASPTYVSITSGYYTPESMAKTITESFAKENVNLTVNTRTSLVNILNPKNKYIFSLSNNLKALFGVVSQVNSNILVRKFNSKDCYFINCDLIDREQNLLNGKPSSILARLDVRGTSYEKITYQTA